MTAESERSTSDASDTSGPGPKPNHDLSALPEDSPELLRWRADALMEEMMLGAVDVSAADMGRGPADDAGGGFAPEDGAAGNRGGSPAQNGSGMVENGFGASAPSGPSASSYPRPSGAPAGISGAGERRAGDGGEQANRPSSAPVVPPTPEWRVVSGTGSGRATDSIPADYSQPSYRPTGYESASLSKWQPEFSDADSGAAGDRGPRAADDPRGGIQPSARDESASAGTRPSTYANGLQASEASRAPAAESASYGASYVSAMAVMPSGPRRSSLLPRMSEFDAEALSREIAELHAEIRKILPVGHETAERVQHLLDKANTILTSDPMRSAEVEYYMQQVRTIVQRMRQAHRWSDLYRDRLRVYLSSWALLAMVALTALAMFPVEAEDFAEMVTAAAGDSLFVLNFVGLMGTVMAGALGGALGALLTMRKHAGAEYGLFDRKYGLRGLMLPVIGALAGALIYLVFGVVYYFARINPSLNVVAVALPTLIAFVLGFSQESIYGTRE